MVREERSGGKPGVVITGSSRGIGAAVAVRLATVGYGVSVNYLTNRERAEELVRKIEVAGGRAFAFQADGRFIQRGRGAGGGDGETVRRDTNCG